MDGRTGSVPAEQQDDIIALRASIRPTALMYRAVVVYREAVEARHFPNQWARVVEDMRQRGYPVTNYRSKKAPLRFYLLIMGEPWELLGGDRSWRGVISRLDYVEETPHWVTVQKAINRLTKHLGQLNDDLRRKVPRDKDWWKEFQEDRDMHLAALHDAINEPNRTNSGPHRRCSAFEIFCHNVLFANGIDLPMWSHSVTEDAQRVYARRMIGA